jgi:putative spermidine/putrescine transport system substrate-binding protein
MVPRSWRIALTGAGLAALVGVAGCGSGGSSSAGGNSNPAGMPGGSKVVVGSWGGDYENFQKQFVIPELDKQQGAPQVVFATADQVARKTKLRAQKSSPTGTLDVVELSDVDMQTMVQAGIMEKLDASKIPNLKYVKDKLKNPYWIPHIYSPSVIVYNKDKVNPAPTSYQDLWDPKYSGKIGIQTIQWTDWFHAAATLALGHTPTDNWDAGVGKLKKLAPHTQVFSSQEQLGNGLMSGQVWMTLDWRARAYQWSHSSDTPLAIAVPKEGTFATAFTVGIPKNAPHKEAAYQYLNAMLAPKAQREFAKHMGYQPTVTNSGISKELLAELGIPADKEKLVKPVDIDYVASHTGDWHTTWQQEVVNH